MKKLLVVALLSAASISNAGVLMADIPNGAVVIRDSFCRLDELVNDYPYEGYIVQNKKLTSRACWKRSNDNGMIIFIERVSKERYEFSKIEAKYFK